MKLTSKQLMGSFLVGAALSIGGTAQAALELDPLLSFSGDGWLSPVEAGAPLGTADLVRSIDFNPATGNLIIAGRSSVVVIDGTTGAAEGNLDFTGVAGGTFALNTVGVTTDGVIYGSNLTTNSATSPFKVYRWSSEAAAPTVSYSGDGGIAGARLGDNLDVIGSDASGLIAAGPGSSPVVPGINGFTTITTGVAGTATAISVPTPPAAGDFRLGLTFTDADTVLGAATGTRRTVSFTGSTGTLDGSTATLSASERGMDYAVINGTAYLATIDSVSGLVRLYDASDLASLVLLDSADLADIATPSNGNGTSAVAFGELNGQNVLYAFATNSGIQAFALVPEPATAALGLLGLALVARRRK